MDGQCTIDETNTDVSRPRKKRGMRMTLHSNKLILPEHTANLSRERGKKGPEIRAILVARWEEEERWKSADHDFNFLSISTAPEGFSPLLLY